MATVFSIGDDRNACIIVWRCHLYQCLTTCSFLQLSERTAFLVTFTSFRKVGKITLIFSKKIQYVFITFCKFQSKDMSVSAKSEVKLTYVVFSPKAFVPAVRILLIY